MFRSLWASANPMGKLSMSHLQFRPPKTGPVLPGDPVRWAAAERENNRVRCEGNSSTVPKFKKDINDIIRQHGGTIVPMPAPRCATAPAGASRARPAGSARPAARAETNPAPVGAASAPPAQALGDTDAGAERPPLQEAAGAVTAQPAEALTALSAEEQLQLAADGAGDLAGPPQAELTQRPSTAAPVLAPQQRPGTASLQRPGTASQRPGTASLRGGQTERGYGGAGLVESVPERRRLRASEPQEPLPSGPGAATAARADRRMARLARRPRTAPEPPAPRDPPRVLQAPFSTLLDDTSDKRFPMVKVRSGPPPVKGRRSRLGLGIFGTTTYVDHISNPFRDQQLHNARVDEHKRQLEVKESGAAIYLTVPYGKVNFLGTQPDDGHLQLPARPPPVPCEPLGAVSNDGVLRAQAEALHRVQNARDNMKEVRESVGIRLGPSPPSLVLCVTWPRRRLRRPSFTLLLCIVALSSHVVADSSTPFCPLLAGPAPPQLQRHPAGQQGSHVAAHARDGVRRGHLWEAAVPVQNAHASNGGGVRWRWGSFLL